MQEDEGYVQSGLSVDNVIFGFDGQGLNVLLIKRGAEPFRGSWALPGALVQPDEDLDAAPLRVLKELTGLDDVYLEQVETFGKVDRHPRGRVVTVAYFSLISIRDVRPRASSFAEDVRWFPFYEIESLPFDHFVIMHTCLRKLQRRLGTQPIGFELLETSFTLTELQTLYEVVLNKQLDKRNFRKKILSMKILVDDNSYQEGVPHRPAKLFRFDKDRYEALVSSGFNFDL